MSFSISGTARDGISAAIPGATVTLFDYPSGNNLGNTVSDGSGNFTFSGLAAGDYTLTCTLLPWIFRCIVPGTGGSVFSLQPHGVTVTTANVTGLIFQATTISTQNFQSINYGWFGTSGSSVSSLALSFSIPIALRPNLVFIKYSGGTLTSVTSSLGNTYVLDKSFTDVEGASCAAYHSIPTVTGTDAVTANFSPNTSFGAMYGGTVQANQFGLDAQIIGGIGSVFGVVATGSKTIASGTTIDSDSFSTQVPRAYILAMERSNPGVAATSVRGLLATLDHSGSVYLGNAGHGDVLGGITTSTIGFGFGSSTTNPALTYVVWGWLNNGIWGNCGVGGATVSYSGPRSGSVTADVGGNYYIPFTGVGDIATWTITPTKAGCTFTPANNTVVVSALGVDATGPNFTGSTTITSAITYTVTESTITATWTTAGAADSKIFAGAKVGVDNALPCAESSHFAVVTGLSPNTTYSCTVQTLDAVSSPQNVTTAAVLSRRLGSSISSIGTDNVMAGSTGDTAFTFKSNDGIEYITYCDGGGFAGGLPGIANQGVNKVTSVSPFTGAGVNDLPGFGASNTYNGQDDPITANQTSTKKWGGSLCGFAGILLGFAIRQNVGPDYLWYRGSLIWSADHGATWGNAQFPGNTLAAGIPYTPLIAFQYGSHRAGWASPIRYAADDGTLGYNTAQNQADGGNAYLYQLIYDHTAPPFGPFLVRSARRAYVPLTTQWKNFNFFSPSTQVPYTIAYQYWIGPVAPTVAQFSNDANWSSSIGSATTVINDQGFMHWPHITFIPAINSYILTTSSYPNFRIAAAPTPAGPWADIYNSAAPSGLTDLAGPAPLHSAVVSNVATNNISLPLVYTAAPGPNYALRITSGTVLVTTPYVPPPNGGGSGGGIGSKKSFNFKLKL